MPCLEHGMAMAMNCAVTSDVTALAPMATGPVDLVQGREYSSWGELAVRESRGESQCVESQNFRMRMLPYN